MEASKLTMEQCIYGFLSPYLEDLERAGSRRFIVS